MKNLTKLYGNLAAVERLHVIFDAMARGDWEEARTLGDTCPKVQYVAQRDMTFTSKVQSLQTIALLHAAFFWKLQGSTYAAALAKDDDVCARCCAELVAIVEAFDRFCHYAGFDAETVLLACGLRLETDRLPIGEIEPDEATIERLYQSYLLNWQ
jgi:hypothetical protein